MRTLRSDMVGYLFKEISRWKSSEKLIKLVVLWQKCRGEFVVLEADWLGLGGDRRRFLFES